MTNINKTIERIGKDYKKEFANQDRLDSSSCFKKELQGKLYPAFLSFLSKALREVAEEAVREVKVKGKYMNIAKKTGSIAGFGWIEGYNKAVTNQQQKAKDYLERK